jgi:hypothetical protein
MRQTTLLNGQDSGLPSRSRPTCSTACRRTLVRRLAIRPRRDHQAGGPTGSDDERARRRSRSRRPKPCSASSSATCTGSCRATRRSSPGPARALGRV